MIKEFSGEYRFLSNFWQTEIRYRNLIFPSVENAYQAAKCYNDYDMKQFTTVSAGVAKRLCKTVKIITGWESVKVQTMLSFLRQKFRTNKELAEKLIATFPQEIQEGNNWHDTFWGVSLKTGYGENNLGKLLMQVREELMGNEDNC